MNFLACFFSKNYSKFKSTQKNYEKIMTYRKYMASCVKIIKLTILSNFSKQIEYTN